MLVKQTTKGIFTAGLSRTCNRLPEMIEFQEDDRTYGYYFSPLALMPSLLLVLLQLLWLLFLGFLLENVLLLSHFLFNPWRFQE